MIVLPRSTWAAICVGLGVILIGVVTGVVIAERANKQEALGAQATPSAPAPKAVVPPPREEETPFDKVSKQPSFDAAVRFTKPQMEDTVNEMDAGTMLLALWSAQKLRWEDVSVAKNETTFASVLKDPDEARGKRACVSGSIVEIAVVKTKVGKLFDGLLHDYTMNIYKFLAARNTGELVANSQARICGVVTGKFDYSNSAGGTGHAIKLVGMFDLPANRDAARAQAAPPSTPAARATGTGGSTIAVAAPSVAKVDEPAPTPARPGCDPPFTLDADTGRKRYKPECLK